MRGGTTSFFTRLASCHIHRASTRCLIPHNESRDDLGMRRIRLRDPAPMPWVEPSQCVHPNPVLWLKFRDSDETTLRCTACGEILHSERLERHANVKGGQTTSGGQVSVQSWLDDETFEMYGEWESASSEFERKKFCLKWRLAGRLHGRYAEPL